MLKYLLGLLLLLATLESAFANASDSGQMNSLFSQSELNQIGQGIVEAISKSPLNLNGLNENSPQDTPQKEGVIIRLVDSISKTLMAVGTQNRPEYYLPEDRVQILGTEQDLRFQSETFKAQYQGFQFIDEYRPTTEPNSHQTCSAQTSQCHLSHSEFSNFAIHTFASPLDPNKYVIVLRHSLQTQGFIAWEMDSGLNRINPPKGNLQFIRENRNAEVWVEIDLQHLARWTYGDRTSPPEEAIQVLSNSLPEDRQGEKHNIGVGKFEGPQNSRLVKPEILKDFQYTENILERSDIFRYHDRVLRGYIADWLKKRVLEGIQSTFADN